MTVRVVHSKVSGLPASTDTSLVSGTHWDEDHVVTGLENVDNTSDLNKPISTATQTALDAKQALDADLTAIAGLSSTGLIARTGSGTVSVRTVTAPASGITVSNGDGVAGNPTLALANDLAALEGLSGTGLAARTASSTWLPRTITGTSGQITITNGDGVAGNPTLALDLINLAVDISPDCSADSLFTYDASASAYKKVSPINLGRGFSAHKNSVDQTGIATATDTKVTFTTEAFDLGGYFDAANSKWVPPAGPVKMCAQVYCSAGLTSATFLIVYIYKNGSPYKTGRVVTGAASGAQTLVCIDVANGTDYYEVYVRGSTTTSITASGSIPDTFFQGWIL